MSDHVSPVSDNAAITVCEVGPRDGFQIERVQITTERQIAVINGMFAAGLRHIQATCFVSPRAVPQLADAKRCWQVSTGPKVL